MARRLKSIRERICKNCGVAFEPNTTNQIYCNKSCKKYFTYTDVCSNSRGNTGQVAEYLVASDLMLKKWYVYKCLGVNSPFDLYAYRDGVEKRIEVKTGRINNVTEKLCYAKPTHNEFNILAVCNLSSREIFYYNKSFKIIKDSLQ